MALHRTFIAIPLPDDARTALRPLATKIEGLLPVGAFRLLAPEDWHITLSFLGDQDDEGVGRVVTALPSLVPMLDVPVELSFDRIVYSPNANDPSLIALMGTQETSALLGEVRDDLENGLIAHEAQFRPDNRRFMAHITLARRTKESVLLPELDERADLLVIPGSVDVLESFPQENGSLYEVLASEPLND